jgi:hypothetical protein
MPIHWLQDENGRVTLNALQLDIVGFRRFRTRERAGLDAVEMDIPAEAAACAAGVDAADEADEAGVGAGERERYL